MLNRLIQGERDITGEKVFLWKEFFAALDQALQIRHHNPGHDPKRRTKRGYPNGFNQGVAFLYFSG